MMPESQSPPASGKVRVRTGGKVFERLENIFDIWSFLRFLVPALLGNLPDRWGHSRDFK